MRNAFFWFVLLFCAFLLGRSSEDDTDEGLLRSLGQIPFLGVPFDFLADTSDWLLSLYVVGVKHPHMAATWNFIFDQLESWGVKKMMMEGGKAFASRFVR